MTSYYTPPEGEVSLSADEEAERRAAIVAKWGSKKPVEETAADVTPVADVVSTTTKSHSRLGWIAAATIFLVAVIFGLILQVAAVKP